MMFHQEWNNPVFLERRIVVSIGIVVSAYMTTRVNAVTIQNTGVIVLDSAVYSDSIYSSSHVS